MLKDVPMLLEITSRVVRSVSLPVTVKTRLGWDHQSIIIEELAEQLQDCGISGLTIHGRTREQLYQGEADWSYIGNVKNNPRIHIPIIGNGDINSPEKAMQVFDRYGVDGIMIGRGSIGNPAIFRDIKHYQETGKLPDPPSLKERVDVVRALFNKSVELKGLPGGILHMRRHLAKNFNDLDHFRELRIKMLRSDDPDELNQILDQIIKRYGP